MPKTDIDYSNTIIYKITCNDVNNKEVYVGHTTNFVQRKHAHKQGCINENSANYKCKLYEVIRNTGGWNNWKMEIINFFNCKDHYEARVKEQEYFVSLNATLNSIEPLPKPKIPLSTLIQYETIKEPIAIVLDDEKVPKGSKKFCCESCDYNTSRLSQYERHMSTSKHLNTTFRLQNATCLVPKVPNIEKVYICSNCNKEYKHHSSLSKHKALCNINASEIVDNNSSNEIIQEKNELIQYLINENKEFKNLILEIVKKDNNNISNNINN